MPKEDLVEQVIGASSRKPRSQRINQLLRQVYELEVLEREIKRTKERLTKINTELHDSLLEMRGMYTLLQKINMRLMKENARLYREIRLSRLQMNNSNPKSQAHLALETLAEETISLQDPDAMCDAAAIPNPMQVAKMPEGQN